ncbi:ABC transporter permease [Subtercola endophyticus]|uniref:ABC transporter permease n=1 Tax=Subtercola endophyticus TaxID=2895559 RepID=UPI001E32674E|nr:ABC transporter permease [Subtercola endophyticus]UFS58776.1 ABC transporter permease [Subtercola endophyticus]
MNDVKEMPTSTAEVSKPESPASAGRRPQRSFVIFAERYALLILTLLLVVFFSVIPATHGLFATVANLNVVLGSQTVYALIAIAALFPLLCGYFDFSVGTVSAVSTTLAAGLMSKNDVPLGLAIVISLVVGVGIGFVNGLFVVRFKLNPFVSTLGMATLLGGGIQWYTGGATIFSGIAPALTDFGAATLFGIPVVVYAVAVVALVAWYVTRQTPFGRSLYAIGSNPTSATLVGLRVTRNVWATFMISGGVAAFSGIILLARTGSATADSGISLLFPALAAVFLGTTAINPGFFNVWGTIIGALFVAVAVSGLTLSGAQSWVSPVFNGAALLAAVGLSSYLRKRRLAG